MSEVAEKLKTALLELPEAERWELVGALFDSLPVPPSATTAEGPEFAALLNRRLAELENGTVKGVPAEEVLERLRRKYAQ